MPTHGPGHLKAFDYVGFYRYFLTFCTDSRQRLFSISPAVALVLGQIEQITTQEEFAIVAYCFIPDHVHLLVEGRAEWSDCRRFIARAKQFSGFHYSRSFGGRLWQRYGFEHVLRNEETTLKVVRYILNNPLRAGIVTRVEDYPFAGSQMYTLEEILGAVADAESPSG